MIEHFPDLYPDEILYSAWARYSDQVHYRTRTDVFQELFGKRALNTVVDLPCHIGSFIDKLPHGHKYGVDYIIDNHTLLPFYRPFLPQERFDRLREQMITGSGHAIHRRAGIAGSNIKRSPWLRYCPKCVEEDRERYGECYWHRLHQIPGAEVCPKHATFLKDSSVRTNSDFVTREFISAERIIFDIESCQETSSLWYKILMHIARDTLYLLEHPRIAVDYDFLYKQYHSLLARQNLMTARGLIRMTDLWHAFMDYYPPALLTILHCEVDRYNCARDTWLSKLARPSKTSLHPLQHLLIMHFLGATVETFFRQRAMQPAPFGEGPWPCLNPVCEHYRQSYIRACKLSKNSTRGRPIGGFSCTCGFTYCRSGPDQLPDDIFRRDKILSYGPIWEAKLCQLWLDPTQTLNSISHQLGVTSSSLYRQAAKLELPIPRSAIDSAGSKISLGHTMKDVSYQRAQWLALVKEARGKGRTALRTRSHGVYEWLNCYDREWLLAHLPAKIRPRKSEISKHARSSGLPLPSVRAGRGPLKKASSREFVLHQDAYVAQCVRAAAYRLMNCQNPPKRVTVRRISIDVPQVLQLKRIADKAPLTMQAVEAVTETSEIFAVRCIRWAVQKYQEESLCPTRGEFVRKLNLHHVLHALVVQQALDEAMDVLSRFT